MAYPNYKNKHAELALFSPSEFIKWSGYLKKYKSKKPDKYILIYSSNILNKLMDASVDCLIRGKK